MQISLAVNSVTRGLMAAGISGNSRAGIPTPSLDLDFVNSETLDPRITFTRASSATYYDADGVLEVAAVGEARFDHNPLTFESLGLLVEEQRTNLLLRSEEFANAGWTKTNATITANTIVAPDGTLTGNAVNDTVDVANTAHQITQGVSVTSGTACTLSAYIKAGTGVGFSLGAASTGAFSAEQRVLFNASTGVATSQLGTATNITMTLVGNGWYRCSCVITPTSTATATIVIRLNNSAASGFYQGNGTQNAFLWGTQFEVGAFPTSYIKTVAATVTRNADAASMTSTNFSSWYRADEGSLYAEGSAATGTGKFPVLAFISDSGTQNSLNFGYVTNAVGGFEVKVSNVSQVLMFPSVLTFNRKVAFAYKTDDFAVTYNGASPSTDTSGIIPVVDRLTIGSNVVFGISSLLNGHIRKLSFYPSRLSNAQLQALTR